MVKFAAPRKRSDERRFLKNGRVFHRDGPHPPVFVHLLIPQGFKSFAPELRIPKDLRT